MWTSCDFVMFKVSWFTARSLKYIKQVNKNTIIYVYQMSQTRLITGANSEPAAPEGINMTRAHNGSTKLELRPYLIQVTEVRQGCAVILLLHLRNLLRAIFLINSK